MIFFMEIMGETITKRILAVIIMSDMTVINCKQCAGYFEIMSIC